jgi:hypothetical protein
MPKMPLPGQRVGLPPIAAVQRPILVDRSGEHYRIRTLRQGEVNERFTRWLTDPAVAVGLNMPGAAMGLDSFRSYVGSFDNIWRNLLAIRLLDDDPIGLIMTESLTHNSALTV